MPKGLYITSTQPYAGKSMLCIGIGQRFQKDGIQFGYMKPLGSAPLLTDGEIGQDQDAAFACDIFGIQEDPALVTPIQVTQDFKMQFFNGTNKDYMPQIKEAFEKLCQNKETMIVSGTGHYYTGKFCNLDNFRIAKELGLKVLVVDRLTGEAQYDKLLHLKEIFGDTMLGAVLNDIPAQYIPEIEAVTKPFLERNNIPVYGIIQSDPLMRAIKVSDLAEQLGGRVIAAQNDAGGMVENFLIGTMQVENFMTYFRRNPKSAIIVGGDRADVQLVAIEGECPCIILTGNLYPNDIILSRADTLKVPIIMVRDDTYVVAHRMEELLNRYKMHDIKKVRQAGQLVESAIDMTRLKSNLGLM